MQPSDNAPVLSLHVVLARDPLAQLAWRAASEAGRFLADERPDALTIEAKSSPTDVVTVMDRTAEALLIDRLLGARPDDGLLGEEGGERPGTSGIRWVVDPLDGTVNYLYGLPMWGVSVAAEDSASTDGGASTARGARIGVVITPDFDEGYLAIRGVGAWHVRAGLARPLSVRTCPSAAQALVVTGFGYTPRQRAWQASIVSDLLPVVRDLRRSGAAVIDLCWLARGRTDAYFEHGLNLWDVAAGALIAAEAGADVSGGPGTDRFLLVAVPGIAAELSGILDALHDRHGWKAPPRPEAGG